MHQLRIQILATGLVIGVLLLAHPGIAGNPPHETSVTTLLDSDFSSGLAGWTVIDGGDGTGPAPSWTADNPGGRTPPHTPPFAICDSDYHGFGEMDEQLISASVDATGYESLTLSFHHSFNWYSGGWNEVADVDVRSSATGGSWLNVARFEGASAEGVETIDIGSLAGADLQIRFYYHSGNWEYWWAVDDVTIFGVSTLVFRDDFESGDVSQWSGHNSGF